MVASTNVPFLLVSPTNVEVASWVPEDRLWMIYTNTSGQLTDSRWLARPCSGDIWLPQHLTLFVRPILSTNSHFTLMDTLHGILGCYPYFKNDPFIITRTPHLYFIGNQPRFESMLLTQKDGQKTRVVLIPRFSETGQVILVNPRNLDIKVVSIGMGWEEST